MVGLIDGLPIGDFGLGALVTLVIFMIFTGRLVPKRHLDDCREDLKLARVTNENQAATLAQIDSTLRSLVEFARTSDHVLREIQGKPTAESEKEGAS